MCNDYCIIVFYFIGDFVIWYFLDNQVCWFQVEGFLVFKILVVIDYLGVGGGIEFVDFVFSIVYNDSWYNWLLKVVV